jgi:hypothetical protein
VLHPEGIAMSSQKIARWFVVIVVTLVAAGCVIVPYKPKAEVVDRRDVEVDSSSIVVTIAPRQLIEKFTEAIEDEDEAITVVPPQEFIDAAFIDQDASLAKMLEPETCARVRERVQTDYLVLIGEVTESTQDEHGGMAFYMGFFGAQSSEEHATAVATVIDLVNARPLAEVSSHAQGRSRGVGAFYGLFVVPLTDSSARDGLARAVVADIRSQSGPGKLRIAVLAAEKIPPPPPPPDTDTGPR